MKINYFQNTEYVVRKVTLFYIFENIFNVWLKRKPLNFYPIHQPGIKCFG